MAKSRDDRLKHMAIGAFGGINRNMIACSMLSLVTGLKSLGADSKDIALILRSLNQAVREANVLTKPKPKPKRRKRQ